MPLMPVSLVNAQLPYSGARIFKSSTQALGAAAWTAVTWDSETWDTDNYHSTVSLTNRITIPVTGRYRVSCVIGFGSGGSGSHLVSIGLSGEPGVGTDLSRTGGPPAAAEEMGVLNTADLQLNAADFLVIGAWSTSAKNIGPGGIPTFCTIQRIS